LENQRVLAALKVEGICDQSAVVEELGIQVELKDGKVSVKPRPKNK
jgi:hypothetical protein